MLLFLIISSAVSEMQPSQCNRMELGSWIFAKTRTSLYITPLFSAARFIQLLFYLIFQLHPVSLVRSSRKHFLHGLFKLDLH